MSEDSIAKYSAKRRDQIEKAKRLHRERGQGIISKEHTFRPVINRKLDEREREKSRTRRSHPSGYHRHMRSSEHHTRSHRFERPEPQVDDRPVSSGMHFYTMPGSSRDDHSDPRDPHSRPYYVPRSFAYEYDPRDQYHPGIPRLEPNFPHLDGGGGQVHPEYGHPYYSPQYDYAYSPAMAPEYEDELIHRYRDKGRSKSKVKSRGRESGEGESRHRHKSSHRTRRSSQSHDGSARKFRQEEPPEEVEGQVEDQPPYREEEVPEVPEYSHRRRRRSTTREGRTHKHRSHHKTSSRAHSTLDSEALEAHLNTNRETLERPVSMTSFEEYEAQLVGPHGDVAPVITEYPEETEAREKCEHCTRSFLVSRLEKHQNVCLAQNKERNRFKTEDKRLTKEQIEAINKAKAKPFKKPQHTWRHKSKNFRSVIQQGRLLDSAKKSGKDLRSIPVLPQFDDPGLVECPHCGRKFAEKTAERHIPSCKITANKPQRLMAKTGKNSSSTARKT